MCSQLCAVRLASQVSTHLLVHLSTHLSHHLSLLHSFTPGSKPTFSTNPSHLNTPSTLNCLHDCGTERNLSCFSVYFQFVFFFNFSVCPSLRWLHVGYLLHVKYSVSYRIVSYHIGLSPMNLPLS